MVESPAIQIVTGAAAADAEADAEAEAVAGTPVAGA